MNILTNRFNVLANPKLYGPLITFMTVVGFTCAAPFYYFAGKQYKKILLAKQEKEEKLAAFA